MRIINLFLLGVVAAFFFVACDSKEDVVTPDNGDNPDNPDSVVSGITVETNEWHAPAVGALTAEIGVTSSEDWEVTANGAWLIAAKTSTGVRLTASQNSSTTERTATVTLTTVSDDSAEIVVNQDGKVYLSVSSTEVEFGGIPSSAYVEVESNFDWTCSYNETNGWLTAERDEDDLKISVTMNDSGGDRQLTLTLVSGDGAENVAEEQISVVQTQMSSSPLVLCYKVSSANTTIGIPISGNVSALVDWGDGSDLEEASSFIKHTFAAAGEYDVSVYGTVTSLNSQGVTVGSAGSLISVKQWGNTGLTNMEYAFYNCSALSSVAVPDEDSFAGVVSFLRTFYGCTSLTNVPAEVFRNCRNATTFEHTFSGSALSEIPAGLFDDCVNAEVFRETFRNCTAITSIPPGLFDNCVKATIFYDTFYSCSITEIPSGLFDNCTEVTSFYGTFQECEKLKEIPKGLFDKNTKVTDTPYTFAFTAIKEIPDGLFASMPDAVDINCIFGWCAELTDVPANIFGDKPKAIYVDFMFDCCTSLKTVPEGLLDGCTGSTTFSYFFYGCTALESVPESLFANGTVAKDFTAAFAGCRNLKEIPPLLFANNVAATDMTSVFRECSSLTSVPEGLFDNNVNVTDIHYAFLSCSSLKTVPPDLFSNCREVTVFDSTFSGCYNLTGESPYTTLSDGTRVHFYERANYPSEFSTPKTYSLCFSNCTGLSDYSSIPSGWR